MEVNELIRELRNRGLQNGSTLGHHSGLYEVAADALEIQQKRIAELEKQRRWIPVTERLPDCEYGSESKPLFFVTRFGDIEAGYFGMGGIYRDKYFRIYRDRYEGYDADDIVCWMWQSALSEPPKEDAT